MKSIGFINGHIKGADTCAICGRDIPEGKQYCTMCEEMLTKDINYGCFKSEDSSLLINTDTLRGHKEPCYLCDNARLNDELEDYNDFHSSGIGSFSKECRMMLTSGSGKPLRIEVARWSDKGQEWEDIGIYYPKFCPECGREIGEYGNDSFVK